MIVGASKPLYAALRRKKDPFGTGTGPGADMFALTTAELELKGMQKPYTWSRGFLLPLQEWVIDEGHDGKHQGIRGCDKEKR